MRATAAAILALLSMEACASTTASTTDSTTHRFEPHQMEYTKLTPSVARAKHVYQGDRPALEQCNGKLIGSVAVTGEHGASDAEVERELAWAATQHGGTHYITSGTDSETRLEGGVVVSGVLIPAHETNHTRRALVFRVPTASLRCLPQEFMPMIDPPQHR